MSETVVILLSCVLYPNVSKVFFYTTHKTLISENLVNELIYFIWRKFVHVLFDFHLKSKFSPYLIFHFYISIRDTDILTTITIANINIIINYL